MTSDTGPIVNNKVSFADNTSGYYLGDEEFIVGNASTFLSFSPATQFDLVTPELTITGGSVDFSGTVSTSDDRFKVQNSGDITGSEGATVCEITTSAAIGETIESTSTTNPALVVKSQSDTGIRVISSTGGSAGGVGVDISSNSFSAISAISSEANGAFLRGQISGAYVVNTNIDPVEDTAGRAALIIDTQVNHRPHIQMLTQHTVFPVASDGAIIFGKSGAGNRIYARFNGQWHLLDFSGSWNDGAAMP
mgnify:FL=1